MSQGPSKRLSGIEDALRGVAQAVRDHDEQLRTISERQAKPIELLAGMLVRLDVQKCPLKDVSAS